MTVTSFSIGEPIVVPGNFGDTWSLAWADDDRLYSPSNDSFAFSIPPFLDESQVRLRDRHWETGDPADERRFFEQLSPTQRRAFWQEYRPIAFNRLEGDTPEQLRGAAVNPMTGYGFFPSEQLAAVVESGMPQNDLGTTWKSSGCTFVDGSFYWTVARHTYPHDTNVAGLRQSARDASIIRSDDYGRTWHRSAAENLARPMFPGSAFATPYFVSYAPEAIGAHRSDSFVYAISNNGYWDNGDSMILGRVPRSAIGRLDGSDWEFYAGDADAWADDPEDGRPILERAGALGSTGATYLTERGVYLMVAWHYPGGSGFFRDNSSTTTWTFYEAPAPWGPWAEVHSHTWSPQGYYCPSVSAKFQTRDTIYIATAGDFKNWWDWYRLTFVPVTITA